MKKFRCQECKEIWYRSSSDDKDCPECGGELKEVPFEFKKERIE